jgi:molybdopterin-guanine dinucleotide biosynthesis protein A
MIAAIQAGGRSLRMGEDKAWLCVGGRPMIEQVLSAAREVADRLAIVIHPTNPNRTRYERLATGWGAGLWLDEHDHRGPLGGIETVLQQCEDGASALILACDLPFVTGSFLQQLQAIHLAERPDLTVPLDAQGRPQMLAAIYAKTCLPAVTALLVADELKVRLLQQRVNTRHVLWAEYAHLPHAQRLLTNLNMPEDMRNLLGQE